MSLTSERKECHKCGPSYEPVNIEYVNCDGNNVQRYFAPGEMDSFCIDRMVTNPNRFCKPLGVLFSDENECPKQDMKKLKCQCVEVTISESDLHDANNNSIDGLLNGHTVTNVDGKVFLTVFECGNESNPSSIRVFDSSGIYNICVFSIENVNNSSLFYFKNDSLLTANNSSYVVSDNSCMSDNDCV
jgi:hypothetical protein